LPKDLDKVRGILQSCLQFIATNDKVMTFYWNNTITYLKPMSLSHQSLKIFSL
jgi:hypothetical protein